MILKSLFGNREQTVLKFKIMHTKHCSYSVYSTVLTKAEAFGVSDEEEP